MTIADGLQPQAPPRGIGRADAILTAIEEGARTAAQVAERTGLHRTTTYRLIGDLQARGYVATAGSYGYVLGPRILRLATTAMREMPLRNLAQPVLERLSASTGESAQLYVQSGDRRICVAAIQSANELRTIVDVGASLPLTAGSAGKVFLAWLPEAARRRLIEAAPKRTGRTPVGEQLARQVATARRRGWATSSGEREGGVGSVSAPIRDGLGSLHGVVSISGPVTRVGPPAVARYAAAVTAAAVEIETALGA